MKKLHGYGGRILRVDLTGKKISKQILSSDFASRFLGGKGFAVKILLDELTPGINPLSSENKIVFATGPLTGSLAPCSSRGVVASKSPLTNGWGDANAGGFFNAELKFAGYDVLIVEGCSKDPVYLWINDDEVEIRKAENLWGKNTQETDSFLKKDLEDNSIQACYIGPAGENLVRFANIMSCWHRAFGRTGLGAVMGSKKLKAIAVRGTRGFEVFRLSEFMKTAMEAMKQLHGYLSPTPSEKIRNTSYFGTSNLLLPMNASGMLPTRNFQSGVFEHSEEISGESMRKSFVVKDKACIGCPIASRKITCVKKGPYMGTCTSGPEYETIYAFGSNCGNSNLESIIKASHLCDLLGIDTISCGDVIAFAMECHENNQLSSEIVRLNFGNSTSIIKLVEMIAYRQEVGNLLAEGTRIAAEKLGTKDYAMESKGLELPGYDLRGAFGHALATATSDRGGCHLRGGWTIAIELWNQKWPSGPASYLQDKCKTVNRFSSKHKGKIVKWMQDWYAAMDSIGLCYEAEIVLNPKIVARLVSGLTGFSIDDKSLLRYGERTINLTRLFLIREGFSRNDDTLPKRFLKKPLPSGNAKGRKIGLKNFERMLDDYYAARGWDSNGYPTRKKLFDLDIINDKKNSIILGKTK
jgi:aldehyde:ferredoxin oxidoreductase